MRNTSFFFRERRRGNIYVPDVPLEIAIQLTYKCNLRCKSCMQWNNDGFHSKRNDLPIGDEISIDVIQEILNQTSDEHSCIHLWGGEPLVHSKWENICQLLSRSKRRITLSTNGILIKNKIDSLLAISSRMNTIISLDGFEKENDIIRGKHTFAKAIDGIHLLQEYRNKQQYKGTIIINTVISDYIVDKLFNYVKYVERLGIDKLVLSFPWFISKSGAAQMNIYYSTYFAWLNYPFDQGNSSWDSFAFNITQENYAILADQLERIRKNRWSIEVRIQPSITSHELDEKIYSHHIRKTSDAYCMGISNRLAICANGDVTACPDFPEFRVGNIYAEDLLSIWSGRNYTKLRELRLKQLWPLPICFKCSLYSKNRI
jgi:radical SAM protein with 4Fe4S-binding SPASM domain